jgi:tRNA A37 threonylcarbamoyltransferase TsaD
MLVVSIEQFKKKYKIIQWTVAGGVANNFYPALVTATQLMNESKPYYTVQNSYMIWYEYLVIRLNE